MTRPNPLRTKLPRTDRYLGCMCAVTGCERQTRAFSRYCALHARQLERTRNPTGRMPKQKELAPWRELCRVALTDWGLGTHPAVVALEHWFVEFVERADRFPSKYAAHLHRLKASDVDGRTMLVRCMGMVGLQHIGHPGSALLDQATCRAALGSQFLRSAPVGRKPADWVTGKPGDAVRISGLLCEQFGELILETVGGAMLQLWQRIEQERMELERNRVRLTLEANPL